MSFFNFGDSPDRSAADTSFTFSFSGNEDVREQRENKDESQGTFSLDWTAGDSKVVSKPDVDAPVIERTKVENPSPAKQSPEKVLEKIHHHREGELSGVLDARGTKDDTIDEVTIKEVNQHNVDLIETMKGCMDDIRRKLSTFLPALQAQKVICYN